jgi:hypothetical protein
VCATQHAVDVTLTARQVELVDGHVAVVEGGAHYTLAGLAAARRRGMALSAG